MPLSGLTRKYSNAFSIVSPLIVDLGELTLLEETHKRKMMNVLTWGFTARRECLKSYY